jgi:hypothetical protein
VAGRLTVEIDELKGYLKIDKNRLDEELEEQPMLLFKISEAYVQAAAERDMLKEALATTDAKLDRKARESLERSEEKVTEAMVKNWVQTDKEHATATRAYLDAKQQAELLVALRDAFQSRGYFLRDLATLYTANYYEQGSAKPTNTGNRATYSMKRAQRERLREDA